MKRTIQELTDYKDVFFTLLNTLRVGHIEKVEEMMTLIRDKNGSIEDIAHFLGHRVPQFSDSRTLPTVNRLLTEEDSDNELRLMAPLDIRIRRASAFDTVSPPEETQHLEPPKSTKATLDPYARVSLESLCDIPLFRVPAKPWTTVTGDNDFVSHLMSLYFTWEHPCTQFIDQRAFLEHMGRRDLNSEICTPFLVNSLLAMASV